MNDDQSWQKPLDNFLANNDISTDTRVLARALSDNSELINEKLSNQHISELEQALHIEQHLHEIGLQPLPTTLTNKLQSIGKSEKNSRVVFGYFKPSWKKLSALAATVTAVALLNSNMINAPTTQQPSLAEIKQAQQELAIALQYIAFAKNISTEQINQTFNENIQQPLNQGLLKPLTHFKETS
jgi:hypothetical protein|tara:strand:- start:5 stop:556 length:552 start_codon:yes stop_codon:yes gene_type:complete